MADYTKLIYGELSYKLTGILFGVHNELGRYCNEKQYADAIERCLLKLNFRFEREKILPPSFENEMKGRNKIDFVIDDKIILEIKAKRFLAREDYFQVKRYLTAFNKKLGIIVNFHQKYITPKRILNAKVNE